MSQGERVGEVTHFFDRISVAVLKLSRDLKVGDVVHFLGPHTDFRQEITSMQIEHESITAAEAGQEVAVKVQQRVRKGVAIFRLSPED